MIITSSGGSVLTLLASITTLITAITALITILKQQATLEKIHTATNSTNDKLRLAIEALQVNQATPQEILARAVRPSLPLLGTPTGPPG